MAGFLIKKWLQAKFLTGGKFLSLLVGVVKFSRRKEKPSPKPGLFRNFTGVPKGI